MRSEPPNRRPRWRLILAVLAAPVCALFLYGLVVQQWRTSHDVLSTLPPPGQLVDVGGHTMHLDCRGEATRRAPTVVLESGLTTSSRIWQAVQDPLAESARVCSYDRSGYGWSRRADGERGGERIAAEMWALLDAAGERPPFVLVGHSAGGLYVRAAQAQRPEAVTGLVLVDPSHESMDPEASDFSFSALAVAFRRQAPRYRWGLAHWPLAESLPEIRFPGYPHLEQRVMAAMLARPSSLETFASELDELTRSTSDYARSHRESLRDVPLVVLTRSLVLVRPHGVGAVARPSQAELAWHEAHREIAALSSRGEHVTARSPSHDLHVEEPELVIEAIRGFLTTP